jgi:hypothetical protein
VSTFVGESLPELLLARLGPDRAIEHADRAIVLCSVDEQGWPHPAMVTSLELVARDARNIRLVVHSASRTARNLRANGRLTVIVADEDGVHYLKGDVLPLAVRADAPEEARFNLRVDSVLQDAATAHEYAHLVSGIRVTRRSPDDAAVRARLDRLQAE